MKPFNSNREMPKPSEEKSNSDLLKPMSMEPPRVDLPSVDVPKESKAPEAPKSIKVRALRPGFFGGQRKVEGDEFFISSEKELGKWMKKVKAAGN